MISLLSDYFAKEIIVLKKMRKRLRQRRLATTLAIAMALALPVVPARADIGAQSFNDGQAHVIADNITTTDNGLQVTNPGTSATISGKTISITGAGAWGTGARATAGGKITLNDVTVYST